ncbi:hypothetical protein GCM10010254_11830 [Streptomyces chromofuscus]|nr:hypothetical protein GCM10010254_11830 [Streptomyces chromofuscus]
MHEAVRRLRGCQTPSRGQGIGQWARRRANSRPELHEMAAQPEHEIEDVLIVLKYGGRLIKD